jgi:hypothetical protein
MIFGYLWTLLVVCVEQLILGHDTIEMQIFCWFAWKKHGNKHVLGFNVIVKTKTAPLLLWFFKHRIMKGRALNNQVHPICSIHAYNPLRHELNSFCVLCFMYWKNCRWFGRYTKLYRKVYHWLSYVWLRCV